MLIALLIVSHEDVIGGAPGREQKRDAVLPNHDTRRATDRTYHMGRAQEGIVLRAFIAAPDENNLRTFIGIGARYINKSSLCKVHLVTPLSTIV
jgi:hypothetical protein